MISNVYDLKTRGNGNVYKQKEYGILLSHITEYFLMVNDIQAMSNGSR